MNDGKNVVVCCDGTGNVWKPSADKTNVVKLVECLTTDQPARQLHYYDPGVGTPDGYLTERDGLSKAAILMRVAGLVWGDGVWTNVAEAYRFLMTSYAPGDRIFLFGFSRGAFTARAVSGLINLCGMLRPGTDNLIPTALKIYRMRASRPEQIRRRTEAAEQFRRCFGASYGEVPIHFIGVWDTVESVGVAQLALGTRITSDRSVKPRFLHVRHAVALDELRWPYTPRLYDEAASRLDPERQTFKQVWFAGAHCDVGGGYNNSGLAHSALHWMVREAHEKGLLIDFDKLNDYGVDPVAKLHDETVRVPLWMLVGASKRAYPVRMTVHESVVERINGSQSDYRPPLPADYAVERTRTSVVPLRASGPVELAVPRRTTTAQPTITATASSGLPKQRIGMRHWIMLAIGGGVAAWRILGASADERTLALLQVTGGWHGQLGQVLTQWQSEGGASTAMLIAYDFVTIVAYTLFIAVVTLLLSRLAARDAYPRPGVGAVFRYSGGLLPVADVLENGLTLWVISTAGGQNCFLLPCHWVEAVVSVFTSVASVLKLATATAFIVACAATLMLALLRARQYR